MATEKAKSVGKPCPRCGMPLQIRTGPQGRQAICTGCKASFRVKDKTDSAVLPAVISRRSVVSEADEPDAASRPTTRRYSSRRMANAVTQSPSNKAAYAIVVAALIGAGAIAFYSGFGGTEGNYQSSVAPPAKTVTPGVTPQAEVTHKLEGDCYVEDDDGRLVPSRDEEIIVAEADKLSQARIDAGDKKFSVEECIETIRRTSANCEEANKRLKSYLTMCEKMGVSPPADEYLENKRNTDNFKIEQAKSAAVMWTVVTDKAKAIGHCYVTDRDGKFTLDDMRQGEYQVFAKNTSTDTVYFWIVRIAVPGKTAKVTLTQKNAITLK